MLAKNKYIKNCALIMKLHSYYIRCIMHFLYYSFSVSFVCLDVTDQNGSLPRCIALWCNTPEIWEYSRNVENTRLRPAFSTFTSCQIPVVICQCNKRLRLLYLLKKNNLSPVNWVTTQDRIKAPQHHATPPLVGNHDPLPSSLPSPKNVITQNAFD